MATLPKYPKTVWEKQLTKQELELLQKQFNKEYDFLYENENVAGADEAMEFGDELINAHDPLVAQFGNYRQDLLTSDREVAAFAFAVVELGWR